MRGLILLISTAPVLFAQTKPHDVESLHTFNANFDLRPGWTLQLHTRLRTFENVSAFNQFRAGPILMVQLRPRLLTLAGYYHTSHHERVTHRDFRVHRIWVGAQARVLNRSRWTMDARTLTERFVSAEFTDHYRFRNRVMVSGRGEGNGRRWLPFVSAEVLRQQNIWYGRYTAGVQYRPRPGIMTSFGYEFRPSPNGPPSHVLATMIQFDRVRFTPPHIDY